MKSFNIFQILGVQYDRNGICKVIYELLQPSGTHGMGSLFLKKFVRDVLNLEIPDAELEAADVYHPYFLESGETISIVIRTEKHFVPIEIELLSKVHLWTIREEYTDYYKEAAKYQDNAKVFYLVSWNDTALYEEARDIDRNIVCLPFWKYIYAWLSDCINTPQLSENAPVREVIIQFSEMVKMVKELIKTDTVSREVRDEMMRLRQKLYDAVKEAVKKKCGREAIPSLSYRGHPTYTYKDSEIEVYLDDSAQGTFVSFYLSENADCTEELLDLRDELEIKAYAWNNKDSKYPLGDDFYSEYCRLGDLGSPSFSKPNEAMFALRDDNRLEEFAEVCAEKIVRFLSL